MLRRLRRPATTCAQEPDWEAIYGEVLPRLYRYFCYRVSDGPTAEDLTSTTFEKVWRARNRYRHDLAAFSTWIFAIARNVANDYFRRQTAHPEERLEEWRTPADNISLDDAVQQQFDFVALAQVLATLTARERDVLSLKYGAEMNHKDLARVTGLSESNVAVIAHRALHTLRERWAGPSPFEE